MSAQQALALPLPAASNTVVINARCSLRVEADQRVIVVGGLPVHHYRAEDAVAEAYAMVFLVESGFAQQTDVARAFARSVRTVRRHQGRYVQGGMAALGREEGWRRGRRRISGKRLRSIELLKSQGMSNRAIAHRLGVSEKAIRKLVGASTPAESAQLAFAGMTTAAAGAPPAAGVPSAKSTDDDADGSAPSAKDRVGDPISAAADDAEPVPMSLDRDASDRSFDRQLAHLGLLDDAAPLFREGASVPGVGVLLALPCLVESGLFRISRKLYGEIGAAFYGLRTTLLTLLLMALLRIKRPEHLKERDPAAFGRFLGLDRAPEVKTLTLTLADNAVIVARVKASAADIKAGDYVASGGVPQPDGTQKAVELRIFPESMRGNGDGHRPGWPGAPNGTMTNGAVGQTVTSVDGPVLTVKFKDGALEKKLIVGPNVPVSRLEVSDRSELKSGAAVAAAAATKQPDGTFTAARIDVGRGDVVP